MKNTRVLLLNFVLLSHSFTFGKKVTISNTTPRRDVHGHLMDVHDGSIVQWKKDGPYYWYGMGYGNCTEPKYWDCSPAVFGIPKSLCGFQSNHTVNIYSSPDLSTWTLIGDAFPFESRPFGIYFRPKVVFNEQTSLYVLWINRVSYSEHHRLFNITTVDYHNTSLVVATSSSPHGPFTVETIKANLLYKDSPGDFTIFVDESTPNRTAYIAYDAMENHHKISIEPLTWNYLDSIRDRNSGLISPRFHEAPAILHRKGFYYLITGHCCCFCSGGSDGKAYVSNSTALGPYVETDMNINHKDGSFVKNIISAQQNFIAQIGEQLLWTGDRWKSAPDHLKGHDYQYWQLLTFNDSVYPPKIDKLHWQNTIEIVV